MKILALDTATNSCSVAIADDRCVYAEMTTHKNQTHSKHLMQMIDSVLHTAELHISDLGGFAVTIGPGSFTGLRIGISTIKGLALATDKPVVGVSSLETLAWQCAHRDHLICPLLDARKAEIYGSSYRLIDDRLVEQTPAMASAPEKFIRNIKESCVFIGGGAQLYRRTIEKTMGSKAHFMPDDQNLIKASSIVFLSMNRFKSSDTDGVADLIPHYIRKSDAELSIAAKAQPQSSPVIAPDTTDPVVPEDSK